MGRPGGSRSPSSGGSVPKSLSTSPSRHDHSLALRASMTRRPRAMIAWLSSRHVDSVQNEFSLFRQEDRQRLLPWLEEQGVGYLAYGPLAFGLLTGAIREETTFHPRD